MDAEKIVRSFVSGFYGVVGDHRELIRTLISARAQGGDHELDKVSTAVSDKFAEGLRIMRRALLDHGEPRHYDRLDPPLTVAVSAGAVMSVLLLDDWLSRAESAGRAGSGRSTNSRNVAARDRTPRVIQPSDRAVCAARRPGQALTPPPG
jgi:hypothetical protein